MALRDAIYIRRALSSAWGWRCFESRMKDWTCRGATHKRGSPITGRKYKSERRNGGTKIRREWPTLQTNERGRRKGVKSYVGVGSRDRSTNNFSKRACAEKRGNEENTNLWTLVYSAASNFHGSPFAFLSIRLIVSPDPSHIYLSRETCVITIYFLVTSKYSLTIRKNKITLCEMGDSNGILRISDFINNYTT